MFLRKKPVPQLIIASLLFGLSFTPLRLVALIGCIALWTLWWPFSRFISSFVLRLVLTFTLVTAFEQLTGIVFWVCHVAYTVPMVVSIQLLVFLILVFLGRPLNRPTMLARADVTAALLAIISVGTIAFTTLHGGQLLQQMVRQSTTGYDGVQHISLTLSLYDNKGYLYGDFKKLEPKILFNNLASYPQGWSLSSSIWWHGVSSSLSMQKHPAQVLLMYFIMSMIWFGILVYLFARLILYLLELIKGRPNSFVDHIGTIAFTLFAEAAVLIGVPYNSFVSFYPALVFPLSLVFFTAGLLLETKVRATANRFLVEGLLLAGGVAFSWLLAAPAVYLTVILAILAYFDGAVKPMITWLFSSVWRLAAAVVLLLLASGQGFVQLLYGVKGLVNYIGTAGILHNLILYTFLIITLTAVLYSKATTIKKLFVCSMAGIFITAGGVYLYQLISAGTANYFSTKIAFIAFMLVLVFAAVFITEAMERNLTQQLGQFTTAFFLVCLIIFVPVASNMDLSNSNQYGLGSISYMKGQRYLSEYSASQVSDLLAQKKIDNANLVMYKHLNYNEDVITTHFVQMLSRTSISSCNEKVLGDMIGSWTLDTPTVKRCAAGKPYYVITDSTHLATLRQAFSTTPNIQVIESN